VLDLTIQEQQTLIGLFDPEYKRTTDISNRRKLSAQRHESFFLKCYLATLSIAKMNSARDRRWVWSSGRMAPTGNNGNNCTKTRPSATLTTTHLTRTVLGLNTTLRGERPATDRVSHGSAVISYARSTTQASSPLHTNHAKGTYKQGFLAAVCVMAHSILKRKMLKHIS
jgi:hypothetical protein